MRARLLVRRVTDQVLDVERVVLPEARRFTRMPAAPL